MWCLLLAFLVYKVMYEYIELNYLGYNFYFREDLYVTVFGKTNRLARKTKFFLFLIAFKTFRIQI